MYTSRPHAGREDAVRPALTNVCRRAGDLSHAEPALRRHHAATWGEWYGGTYIQSERRAYVCDAANNPPPNCIRYGQAIDKCRRSPRSCPRWRKIFSYKKKIKSGNGIMI
jgi:hypothetical protein